MWDLLFINLDAATGVTVTGTGAAVIISTWCIVWRMNRARSNDIKEDIDKKADKIYVDGEFKSTNIEILNIKEHVHKFNETSAEMFAMVENSRIIIEQRLIDHNKEIDSKLNIHYNSILEIIKAGKK